MALALFSGTTFDSPRKADGTVNAGGKVWFYEPGTSTKKDAYTTSALTTATTNPLILDAYGLGTAWLNGSYKIRVTDSADVLLPDGEEDNYNKGSSFDITAVTAARTMVGVDDTGSFTHSGTYTVSLTQASTLGAGWFTDHYNIGTGVITFARLAAADTINGSAANFTLQPGEFVRITVNSGTTGFVTVLHKQNLYATAAGTDTYTCTFAPAISALYDGQKMRVRFTNANTVAAPTLNANGLGAKTIKKEGSAALVAGDIPAGHEAELTYNGTDFILANPTGNSSGTYTPTWYSESDPQPDIGNGSISGAYTRTGKLVVAKIVVSMGASTTFGTGEWGLSLPFADDGQSNWHGSAILRDASANTRYLGVSVILATAKAGNLIARVQTNGVAGYIDSAVPFAWANADTLHMTAVYSVG